MKNKLTENDPRLTAYALGELPRDEAEEIARFLDAPLNGPLKREVNKIDALGVMLTQTLDASKAEKTEDVRLKLSPSQRDSIFRSAKAPTVNDVSSTHQSVWLRPVLVTLAAAAVVTVSFIILDNVDSGRESKPEVSFSGLSDDQLSAPIQPSDVGWEDSASSVSSQGVIAPNHGLRSNPMAMNDDSEQLIKLVENDWVNRADKAVTRIPLVCGNASWSWIKRSIELDGVLPNKNAVRTEEVLNTFSYEQPTDLEQLFTTSGVELVQCPWNVERMIAIVLVKNKHNESVQVEAAITFSEMVERYKLVGYSKAESAEKNIIAPAKITMAAGDSHIVMYELETSEDIETAAEVLTLNVRTAATQESKLIRDEQTLNVQYSDRSWTKASQDVQFALLLADWCRVISKSNQLADAEPASVAEALRRFELNHTLSDQQTEVIQTLKKGLEISLGFSLE